MIFLNRLKLHLQLLAHSGFDLPGSFCRLQTRQIHVNCADES